MRSKGRSGLTVDFLPALKDRNAPLPEPKNELDRSKEVGRRMSRPYDARALRSKEALRKALLNLVAVRSFEAITIRDITAEAGVSYPVFFRRYGSKEELLEDIATEEVERLLGYCMPIYYSAAKAQPLAALCQYVQEHRRLWTALLTAGAASVMRGEFARIAGEMADEKGRDHPWLPQDLVTTIIVGNIFETIAWWLKQPDDYPIENVSVLLELFTVRNLSQPKDIEFIPYEISPDQ